MNQPESVSTISNRIKQIKRTLKASEKAPFLFKDEEIRYLKTKLREMYAERTDLSKGNGFG